MIWQHQVDSLHCCRIDVQAHAPQLPRQLGTLGALDSLVIRQLGQ